MEIFKLGDDILALLEMVLGFWNNQINLVFSLLGQSPVSFKGGGPWAVVENLQPLFVGVGSGLVVIFFVIGFCAESVDIRSEFRLEAMLRMLLRLGIAQWLVANNLKGVFQQYWGYGEPYREYYHGTGINRCRGSGDYRKPWVCNQPCVPDLIGDSVAYHTGMRIFHHLHCIFPVLKNNGDCAIGCNRLFHPCREPDSEQHLCQIL